MVFTTNIIQITANTTLTTKDDVVLVDASGGSITITLPNILSDGMQYKLKRTDATTSSTVTIQGTGGQTIDGSTTVTLIPGGFSDIQSYNSAWYRVTDVNTGSGGTPLFTTAFVQNNGTASIPFTGLGNQLICSIFYSGSNLKAINAIVFTVSRTGGNNPTGTIGLYTQAGATIGVITIPAITLTVSSISTFTITNLPTTTSILEARVQLTTGGASYGIALSSLTIY